MSLSHVNSLVVVRLLLGYVMLHELLSSSKVKGRRSSGVGRLIIARRNKATGLPSLQLPLVLDSLRDFNPVLLSGSHGFALVLIDLDWFVGTRLLVTLLRDLPATCVAGRGGSLVHLDVVELDSSHISASLCLLLVLDLDEWLVVPLLGGRSVSAIGYVHIGFSVDGLSRRSRVVVVTVLVVYRNFVYKVRIRPLFR